MVSTSEITEKIRSEFNFEVNRLPLSGPDNMPTKWYGLFRSDNGKTVGPGSVSPGYFPHTVNHIVSIAEAAIGSFDEASDVCCHFRDGHYVSIAPTAKYRKRVYGSTHDTIWPRLVISAGLGGSTSFNLTIGYFRDACKNLAMMRKIKSFNIRYRHTASINDRLDSLVEDFKGLREGWESLSDLVDRMNQTDVVIADVIKQVYGEIDPNAGRKAQTMQESRVDAIVRRVVRENRALGSGTHGGDHATAWQMYNAIQGYHQHDAPRRVKSGGEPVTRWDRIITTSNNPNVLSAENILVAQTAA